MQNLIKRIANKNQRGYGYNFIHFKLAEELAELCSAIMRFVNQPEHVCKTNELCNLIEEVADVEIMLEQLKYMHDFTEQVDKLKELKIARTALKMGISEKE